MTQQTLTRLRTPEATGMADAVQQQLEQASTYEGLPFIEQLSLLVEHEQLSRGSVNKLGWSSRRGLKLQATVQEGGPLPVCTQPGAVTGGKPGPRRVAAPGPEPAHYRPCGCGKPTSLCAGLPSLSAGAQHSYYRLPRLLLELEPGQGGRWQLHAVTAGSTGRDRAADPG